MKTIGCVLLTAALLAGARADGARDLDEDAGRSWIPYTLPLPQEIAVPRELVAAPGMIGIETPPASDPLVQTAAAQLRRLLEDRTGVAPTGRAFRIVLGIPDAGGKVGGLAVPDAGRLAALPNRAQGYLVRPVGTETLVLAAAEPRGLFYAVQTLRQLLGRRCGPDGVLVPLAVITDWPDFDERGFWNVGYATPTFIPWLASLKANFCCWGMPIRFTPDGHAECPPLPMDLIRRAREQAFLLMPHAPHYDYWLLQDDRQQFPDLPGKGEGARNPCWRWGGGFAKARNPCMATPLVERLAAEWIESAAAQGAREVSLWPSEHTAQCECEACLKDGRRQMLQETRASVAAIEAARRRFSDLRGRIMFTLTTHYGSTTEDIRACLAMLTPAVKAEHVYARDPAYDAYVAAGGWLATYNGMPLGPGYFSTRYMADETRSSAREYAGARYRAYYPRGRTGGQDVSNGWEQAFCNYQYSAVAEWTWNAKGRDTRQFAEAWATLNGVTPPARFADWIEAVRPAISFARYWEDRPTADWLAAAPGASGAVQRAWATRLPGPEKVGPLRAACAQAFPLADQVSEPSVRLEARYLDAFLQTVERIHALVAADAAGRDAAAGALKTSIADLGERRQALTDTPGGGLKQIMARHDAWAKDLHALLGP